MIPISPNRQQSISAAGSLESSRLLEPDYGIPRVEWPAPRNRALENVSIIVPTLNEAENVPILLRTLYRVASNHGLEGEVLLIDGRSTDTTLDRARRMAPRIADRLQLRVLERPAGISEAIAAGFAIARYDCLLVMDCDLSHPPHLVPQLVSQISRGYDVAVGSRYAPGGDLVNWPAGRVMMSRGATALARTLFQLKVRDPMSGFFAVRQGVVEQLKFSGLGCKILLEILVSKPGLRVVEVPYTFTNRANGKSKLGLKGVLDYIRLLRSLHPEFAVRSSAS